MPANTELITKESAAFAPRAGRKQAPALRIAFLVWQTAVYLALTVFLLEAFFYFARVGDSEHTRPDRKVGYKLFANKRITQRKEGFGCFKLNSFGMQNDEVPVAKAPGVYRVAVFGDSYVEALHVPRKSNFLSVIEERLRKETGRPVEVLNFGVSNYSVAQDYLRYQTLGRQFKPDLVIQTFRVEEIGKLLPVNTTNLLFIRPVYFADYDGHIKYDDTCVRNYYLSREGKRMLATDWLREYSRIWGVIGLMRENWASFSETVKPAMSLLKGGAAAPAATFTLPTDETRKNYANCYWYMMDAQLAAFARDCRADGAQFMLLRTPMIRPGMHELTDNPTETALLDKTARKLNVPLLNLDQDYRSFVGVTTDDGTNFSAGGHFTAPMHRWVGERVAAFLLQEQVLEARTAGK